MENVLHTAFETDSCAPQKDPRLHNRRSVCLHVAVADKSGMAKGEVLDLSLRMRAMPEKTSRTRPVSLAENISCAGEIDPGL